MNTGLGKKQDLFKNGLEWAIFFKLIKLVYFWKNMNQRITNITQVNYYLVLQDYKIFKWKF